MKKIFSFTVLLSILSGSPMANAQNQLADPLFVILDVVLYRPVGVIVTGLGTAAFAGISPLVALASIPKPHDAFQKTAGILVLAPAAYTFARPLGDKSYPYDESTDRHLKDSPDVNSTVKGALPTPVVAPATPVAPVKPSVTPPTDKPAVVNGL